MLRLRLSLCLMSCLLAGCKPPAAKQPEFDSASRADLLGIPRDTVVKLKRFRAVEDFEQRLAQFETVFWDPADTISLRKRLREQSLEGQRVLEIGTGTGLLSLCCAEAGAALVVATDINPSAIANADYNAELLGHRDKLDFRFVSTGDPGAYAIIDNTERFDLIVSNPPWEDGKPEKFSDYAFYDEDFSLLDSLLRDLSKHLTSDGKAWLAYGCLDAIQMTMRLAEKYALTVEILDSRRLDQLEPLFLPGILLEVRPQE